MSQLQVWERIAEEQTVEFAPPEWPAIRRLRWALMHGQAFTSTSANDTYKVGTTGMAIATRDLRDAGFTIESTPDDNGFKKQRIANLDHRPQEFRRQPKPYKSQAKAQPKRQQNGQEPSTRRVKAEEAFHQSAPVTPALGTLLRVGAIAEERGQAALVLVDQGGHRWFVRVDPPQ